MFDNRRLSPNAHESGSGEGLQLPESANGAGLASPTEKLKNLRHYLPGQHEHVYMFASLLVNLLPSLLDQPGGIELSARCLIHRLEKSPYSQVKPPLILLGQPKEFYSSLRELIPAIVSATCPKEFADSRYANIPDEVFDETNGKHFVWSGMPLDPHLLPTSEIIVPPPSLGSLLIPFFRRRYRPSVPDPE